MTTIDLETEDKLEYHFYPITANYLQFRIRAPHDAHIALTQGPGASNPMYEIFFGGWKNSKSVIRHNQTKPDVCEVDTPGILNEDEYRGFWIRWGAGLVTAGVEGLDEPLLSFADPEPFPINYFGLCTGWGASGSWKIEAINVHGGWQAPSQPGYNLPPTHESIHMPSAPCGTGPFHWAHATSGQVPQGAIVAGHDNGEPSYIARAHHEGALIPGKLISSHGCAYIAWGGAEHGKNEYEVLCNCEARWERAEDGNIPPGAVPGGKTEDGEPLFIGRVAHDGKLIPGKLQPSHNVVYIPYGGEEMAFQEYEVLVA